MSTRRNQNSSKSGDQKKQQRHTTKPKKRPSLGLSGDEIVLYGSHAVTAAIANPNRQIKRFLATEQAADKHFDEAKARGLTIAVVDNDEINAITGAGAVHQGLALITRPLEGGDIHDADTMSLVVVLDQITDPHNVGAIIRSAVAMGAEAVISTHKNAPRENGLMAKIASGGLDHIEMIQVSNLAQTLDKLQSFNFLTVGLDSEGSKDMTESLHGNKIALVLGAEGQGLRRLTRERCDLLARLDMPGAIKSLNVSNAAALSLYLARQHLGKTSSEA